MTTATRSPHFRRPLEEILLAEGWVRPEALEGRPRALLGRRLVEAGHLPPERLAEALALQFALPYVAPEALVPETSLLDLFPLDGMRSRAFLPLRREEDRLVVAVADPADLTLRDDLRVTAGCPVALVVASREAIDAYLAGADTSARALREISKALEPAAAADEGPVLVLRRPAPGESPVAHLVETILQGALERRASDVHLEGSERGLAVKYRVDGLLYPAMTPLDPSYHDTVVSRIKVLAELDIAERRVPQDGRFKVRAEGRTIDCRVSVMPSAVGESVVIRILDTAAITRTLAGLRLDALGFTPEALARFRRHVARPHGMVLVTGPTGSGKTTTLYAALAEINTGSAKIVTIEDPIEYRLEGVVQVPVNERKGLTFARGLRSILRHDPDTIMVGEIRDAETAQIAVQSALTGHLVFSTVHANNVVDVIGRFLTMGLEPYNFVSSLNAVVTQRLVRALCAACKAETTGPDGRAAFEPRGCDACQGTGYHGRTALVELVEVSDAIRQLILDRRPGAEIRRAAREAGTRTLREAALDAVLAGRTSLAEADRVTAAEA